MTYVHNCTTIHKTVGMSWRNYNCYTFVNSADNETEMYKIFRIEVTIILQILVNVFAENNTVKIEALEKEKGELFQQINKAIEESVNLLKASNSSEAVLGVKYMEKLKDQIKEINGTDIKDLEEHITVNDTRRSNKLKLSIFELANVFQKDKKTKSKLERETNKIVIKKKIEEWMLQRELEKRKIREYKEKLRKNIKPEKCPRYLNKLPHTFDRHIELRVCSSFPRSSHVPNDFLFEKRMCAI